MALPFSWGGRFAPAVPAGGAPTNGNETLPREPRFAAAPASSNVGVTAVVVAAAVYVCVRVGGRMSSGGGGGGGGDDVDNLCATTSGSTFGRFAACVEANALLLDTLPG